METADQLNDLLTTHFEWLIVRENGRTIPVRRDELEITGGNGKTLLGFFDDAGFGVSRVVGLSQEEQEIVVSVSGRFGGGRETLRLIPRQPAAELAANIELARLEKANEVARIIVEGFSGLKPVRISLNANGGRIAQILVRNSERKLIGIVYDVTQKLTHESILAASLKWLDQLKVRKKNPADELWIVVEKSRSANLRRLLALLRPGAGSSIKIIVIDRTPEQPIARISSPLRLSDLWREKPRKLSIPPEIVHTRTARFVIELDPENIDVVFSRNGETVRYNGLPFVRVRRLMGREQAWFGIDRERRPLIDVNGEEFLALFDELQLNRKASAINTRHELFSRASEAWLESILRRNIKLLDSNLELAPIYNQFRSSNDKIDLLAIRRDGRLVIIELKTSPDRESVLQAADYWRKIELQRRRGVLNEARLFGNKEINDQPALVYCVAPALSFHRDFEYFARMLCPEIELWRWELHQNWRSEINVIARKRV